MQIRCNFLSNFFKKKLSQTIFFKIILIYTSIFNEEKNIALKLMVNQEKLNLRETYFLFKELSLIESFSNIYLFLKKTKVLRRVLTLKEKFLTSTIFDLDDLYVNIIVTNYTNRFDFSKETIFIIDEIEDDLYYDNYELREISLYRLKKIFDIQAFYHKHFFMYQYVSLKLKLKRKKKKKLVIAYGMPKSYLILSKINNFNSSFTKFLSNDSKKLELLFLRKNKVFNKGRYSRNRQIYRTGVYWCLYVNIIFVFGLYFYFYRFMFNFGYLWWLFFVFVSSMFLPSFLRNNFFYLNFYKNTFQWYNNFFKKN